MNLSLKSTKFCGIEEVNVIFSKPLSCILGGNGVGKTSVFDAIRDVLGCPVRGMKQKERKALGRHGEKFSNLLTMDGKELKSSKSKLPSTAEVEAVIPVSRKAMPFALDSSWFIGATAAELKDLFSEVLNLDVDWRASAAKDHGCDKALIAGLPADIKAALTKAKANQKANKKGTAPTPPEDFKVELQAGLTPASKVKVADLDKAIAGVEASLRVAVEEKARMEGAQLSDEDRAKIKSDIAGMEAKIKEAPDRDKISAELESAEKDLAQLTTDYNSITAKQGANTETQENNKDLLGLLCKVCRPKIKESLNIDEGVVADLEKRKTAYVPRITEIQSAIIQLKEQLQATNDVGVLEGTVATLRKQLKEKVDTEQLATLEEHIPMFEEQLAGGRELRETIADYHRAAAQYRKELEQYKAAAGTKDGWSEIVKALPAIEKDAVASGLTPLREILGSFTFLESEITVSEELEITYDGRPYSLMSDSEQYRMSLILHLAVVEMFNFPFVLIDGGEVLVTPEFKANLLVDLRRIATVRPVIYVVAKNDVEIATMVQSITEAAILDIGVFKMADGKIEELV